MVQFIAKRKRKWALIYFHLPEYFTSGPINIIINAFNSLDQEEQENVACLITIYMGSWSKISSSLSLSCNNRRRGGEVQRIEFSKIIDLMIEKEGDPQFTKALLTGLPKELMTKYFDEREAIGYQPPDIIEGGENALLAIANLK